MQALLRKDEFHCVLFPQFLAVVQGVSQYVATLTDEASHFAGWLPYRHRRWAESTDKLLFKQLAQRAGLAVPPWWALADADVPDVLVKRARSSFGAQIKGPYRRSDECAIDIAQGEYYERFIEGRLLKVWYFGDKPVVLELDELPRLACDGRVSVGEQFDRRARLIRRRTPEEQERLRHRLEPVLKYQGYELDAVPPRGTRLVLEFRYGSEFMRPIDRRVIDLQAAIGDRWEPLSKAGPHFASAINPIERAGTVFTVDAVLDAQGEFWFLEMNSNPTVHPLVYPHLIQSSLPRSVLT